MMVGVLGMLSGLDLLDYSDLYIPLSSFVIFLIPFYRNDKDTNVCFPRIYKKY